ncbi:hypothetical protein CU041_04585 [Thalassospira povalilytica]|uniref:Uncharacterized protein n=1 Tax=Thalassospira povalilytica TaxID=732237 RepID=A0ABX4R9Y9_9PROT|nr:hypothetical protein CU041_04585 [Thalassospira povalilytica]
MMHDAAGVTGIVVVRGVTGDEGRRWWGGDDVWGVVLLPKAFVLVLVLGVNGAVFCGRVRACGVGGAAFA